MIGVIWRAVNDNPWLLLWGFIGLRIALRIGQRLIYPGWMVDRQRLFSGKQKHEILRRAGGRCEKRILWIWRCPARNDLEADHFHPWSRGGQTDVANGQALCGIHNTLKWSKVPFVWQRLALEIRRGKYFPHDVDRTVYRLGTDRKMVLKKKKRRRRKQFRRS